MPALDSGAAPDAAAGVARLRRMVGRIAQLVIGSLALATAMASAARAHWIADLATHFPLQYAAAALLAGVAAAGARRPAWALLAVALVAYHGYAAFRIAEAVPGPQVASRPLRLLVSNVFYGNSQYERVVALTREKRPDVAVFVEVSPRWREALRVLERDLPHASAMAGGRHGALVLSRWPLLENETFVLVPGGDPFVRVRLEIEGGAVELVAVHAAWPIGPENARIRNEQLAALADLARSSPIPIVIAGDFNVSPHSPHFQDLLARGGLRSAAQGRRWAPTWPTFFLPGGIPIDHVLVSKAVAVRRFETGPAVGSDHLPLVTDLVF